MRHAIIRVLCSSVLLASLVGVAPPASALSAGLAFSAESLPTWQINGFAYAVTSTAGKVVVGGSFSQLVPPAGGTGNAVGTTGLAVLDADTGAPSSCQLSAALVGGSPTIYALAAAPSGSTVYVGGDFTSLGGVGVARVAAIDVNTCAVTPLRVASVSSTVYGLAASGNTLYLAGRFSTVAGATRGGFAAVDATTGALLPFAANADKPGRAVAVSPDGSKLALGGDFFTVNGAASHSIAVVDAASGATVRAYGTGFVDAASVTKTIVSDGTSFYTGNEGTGTGVFDGRIAVDWSTLDQRWRDTCLGATQSLVVYQGLLYSATHAHDCGSMGGYQNGTRKYFLAETTADHTFRGWTPLGNDGVNEHIGPRGLAVVAGASGRTYLYAVGEFTQINGAAQQGITRFGTTDTNAPGAPYVQAEAIRSNAVQVRVWTVVDSDDDTLTYRVYRNGSSTPMWTGKATSFWWTRPQVTVTDTAVTPGQTYSYKVTASDGTNTSVLSGAASATARTKPLDYAAQVIADGARLYWRFDEPSGTWTWNKGVDSTSAPNGLLAKGVSLGASGAIPGDTAATFDGKDDFAWNDQLRPAPAVFSVETWIKTTTTTGGKIIGYTNSRPQTDTGFVIPPTSYDRHVYMDDTGRLSFGTYNGSGAVIRSSAAYNDGAWHQVVASLGSSGMTLYVDGVAVGSNPRNNASSYLGLWKVGGDKIDGWANKPSSPYFAGQIDDTAVYEGSTLSAAAVANHYALSGRGDTTAPSTPATPTATTRGSDVALSWPTATDDTAVTGYALYRGTSAGFTPDATTLLASPAGTTYTDAGRPAGTSYYRVVARDAAGNRSGASDAVRADVGDTTSPATPGSLQSSVSGSTVSLSWSAPRDDVGVTGYVVYRGATADFNADATSTVAQVSDPRYDDTARPAGLWYYRVAAQDAAGNVSAPSDAVLGSVSPGSVRRTVTLDATADTMVAENNPNGSYGTYNQISTRAPGSASELQAYLRFDLSALPSQARLVSATLQVTTSNDPTAASTGSSPVKLLTGTWSEDGTRWGTRPTDLGATLGTLGSAPKLNTPYTVDLDVAALAPDGSGSLSLALLGSTSDNLRISSREASGPATRPQLTVVYER